MTIRINALPEASPLTGDELTIVQQSGITKKSSVTQVVNYAGSVVGGLVQQAEDAANNAQVSASQAATAESAAELAETAAASSAANALTSENASALSAQNAAASAGTSHDYYVDTNALWTDFDKRYLGPKNADPISDNQNQVLVEGALYWNELQHVMKVYADGEWATAYAPSTAFMLRGNNLSDVLNVSTARDNLGLGTAAVLDAGVEIATLTNGILTASQIPPIAITTPYVVASEAAMLALVVQVGDVAVRTDINKNFILGAEPATALANWVELLSPPDIVQSVNGKIGAVVLVPSDVGAEPADATILKSAAIGVTVQAYNVNTVIDANYVHTDNNYTTTEKNKLAGVADNANNYSLPVATASVLGGVKDGTGVTVAVDGTISVDYGVTAGTAVQGNDTRVTADQAAATASIRTLGPGAQQAATGNHLHTGVYEPADATILKDADIGVSVQAYDVNLTTWVGKTAPTGTVVGTTDTQSLTNKTITLVAGYETSVAIAASDINLALGNCFTKTISTATTFTVSNVPASGTVATFILDLTNGGVATVTWWAGVKWAGGTAPTLTTAGRDTLGFFTRDAGTTWSGFVLGKDIK